MSQESNAATLAIANEDGNVWMRLNRKFLESILADAAKNSDKDEKENGTSEYIGTGYLFQMHLNVEDIDINSIDNNRLSISFSGPEETMWLNVHIDLTPELYARMSTMLIKKFNKAKAVFESIS